MGMQEGEGGSNGKSKSELRAMKDPNANEIPIKIELQVDKLPQLPNYARNLM
jgi:hypothetical protein